MEDAVHGKVRRVMQERLMLGFGFLGNDFVSERYISEESSLSKFALPRAWSRGGRKGKHVRCGILAAKGFV